ncbi:MAG: diacylglycerol kinase family protein [Paracoccaceae bacterium]
MLRYLCARWKSLSHAGAGLAFILKTQPNARIHLAATVLVVIAAILLHVSHQDWRWLILAIALVWVAEILNTAIEYLCDIVMPGPSEKVKRSKDIAAGAVLICAIAAAIIGIMVFFPYIRALF